MRSLRLTGKPGPLFLGKENRLSRCILGVAKVAQTDPDEAETLGWIQANSSSK